MIYRVNKLPNDSCLCSSEHLGLTISSSSIDGGASLSTMASTEMALGIYSRARIIRSVYGCVSLDHFQLAANGSERIDAVLEISFGMSCRHLHTDTRMIFRDLERQRRLHHVENRSCPVLLPQGS